MTRTTLNSTRQPPMAFDVASCTTHAHPTHHPNATPPFEDGRRTLEDLLPNAQVELRLCGPSISAATKPLDLYCPQVRRSPFKDSENVVNHLDVVSCWKGLLHSQAIEIALWEKIFQNCLNEQAQGSLLSTLVLHLFHSNGPMDEHSIMCRMIEYITIHDELLIGIDVTRLLDAMVEQLSVRQCELPCGSFASSRNLPAIICTFFRTRDCFLNTSKGPCLTLRMSHRLSNTKLEIFGEVQWQRPNISFSSLPTNIAPGMEYCISPRHRELQIQYKGQSSHLSTLPPTVVYTVTADVTPLDWMWDPANTCFRTYVSNDYAQMQTAFSAKIVRPFSGNVRFEQTTRYNLNVPVSQIQPHLPCVISRANYPAQEDWSPAMSASELLVGTRKVDGAPALSSPESSKTRIGDPRGGDRDTKALYSPRMAQVEHRGLQKRKAVNRMPSDATFQSPDSFQNPRLALDKFEHLDLEIIKRQKLDRRIDSGVWLLQDVPIRDDEDDDDLQAGLSSVSTGPLGDAFSSPKICSDTWSKRLEADVGHDISLVSKSRAYDTALSKVMPALKKRRSVKRMLFRWPKYLEKPVSLATHFFNGVDQNIASHTTPPGTPASPPSETNGSTLLDLTQSQIQDNYNLFKKQAEVRRTAEKIHEVVSLGRKVSDSEYKEFERIFLGEESQGEDWNTDIDCVDEDTD